MDFQRFGIDPRLAQAAEGLPTNFFFYEKMLSHVVERQENVCVKIALDNGREEVLLLPALQWILSGEGRKALVVAPDLEGADRCAEAIVRLGSGAGIGVGRAGGRPGEGDSSPAVMIGTLEDLLSAPELNLRDYGFLVVDGVDRLAELPPELFKKFCGALLPSWERRSVLASARLSLKAKNLAWDLADNPSEISIEGEEAKAQSVLKETWSVPVDSKLKFLLGLLDREKPARLCVFCNLRDTASEVSRRLSANGVKTDSILGALLPERKFALIEKFRAGDCTCLVLSDEGADGLSPGVFPLIVNYDIPLEPELFVKRLEMLDRSDPGAKVVSLACDRYIAGLPAVEQYIDAKLDALPATEAMLAAVDKSEGMGPERRPRGEGYQRDGRRGPPQRREHASRDAHPRDSVPREANRFRDSSRDAYPRENRSPDIRKSISEATGGALDMNSALPPDSGYPQPSAGRPASGKQPQRPDARRNQERRPGAKDGRRGGKGGPGNRPADSRNQGPKQGSRPQQGKRGPKQGAAGPGTAGPGASGPGASGNPYDMPMEERMKLYREKYGQGLGEEKQAGGRPPRGEPRNEQQRGGQRKGQGRDQGGQKAPRGQQDGQRQRGSSPQSGGAARAPDPRPAERRPAEQRPARPAGSPATPRSPAPRPEGQRKPEGLVNRLLGAFRKKKD